MSNYRLAKEAELRGLYWTGGPWCDWVRQLSDEIADLKKKNSDMFAELNRQELAIQDLRARLQ
jgi:hypothetical protein